MPLYEFHCERCDEEFEELVSRSSTIDEVVCPSCGSGEVRRLQSGFASIGSSKGSSLGSSSCSSGSFG